ncbi:MAG: hypothetical protein ACYS8W_18785 [Planctomycetota bacterium]|jgi:hypothetical protein
MKTGLRFLLAALLVTAVCAWLPPVSAGERHRPDDREREERAEKEKHFHHMLELIKEHRPELYEKLMKIREEHPDKFRRGVIEIGEDILRKLEERERHGDRERGERERDERERERPRHDDDMDRPRDDRPPHRERPRHDDDDRPRHDDRERRGHDEDPDMPSLEQIKRHAKEIMGRIREIDPEMFEKLERIRKEEPEEFLRVLRDIWMDLRHEGEERERHERDDMPSLDEIAERAEEILRNREELAEIKREMPDVFELLMKFKKHGPKPEILERLRDIFMEREHEECEEEGPSHDDIIELAKDLLEDEEELGAIKRAHPHLFELLMAFRKHGPNPELIEKLRHVFMEIEREEEREEHFDDEPISPEGEKKILALLKENNPGWFRELMELRRRDPHAYQRALREAQHEAEEFARLEKEDPETAKLIRKNNQLTKRMFELAEKYKHADNDAEKEMIRNELRGVLNDLFDVRLKKWLLKIKQLEREIEELKKEEKEYRDNKKEIIEEKLKELLGSEKRRFPGG